MDRKVKVRPDQAYRMKRLFYLADGAEYLQLSNLRIYKGWKDFFFQCLCEMEELDLLKSIRTYPPGIISEPEGIEPECEISAAQSVTKRKEKNMRKDRRAARKSQRMKICPVAHLAAEPMGNPWPSSEELTKSWREFFLQVLWELQQDGLIQPVCTAKSIDRQTDTDEQK